MISAYVFDAYGTLFDVHAAIARYRAAAGHRCGPIFRNLADEAARIYLDVDACRPLRGFLDADRARARLCVRPRAVGRSQRCARACWTHISSSMRFPTPGRADRLSRRRACDSAILSNGTPRMLAAAVEAAGIAELSRCGAFGRRRAPIQAAA